MRSAVWPEVVFLIHKAPRTASDIRRLTALDDAAIRTAIHRLEAEGLVKSRSNPRDKRTIIWEWQHGIPESS